METPPRLTPFIGIEFISLKEFLSVPYGLREWPAHYRIDLARIRIWTQLRCVTASGHRALGNERRTVAPGYGPLSVGVLTSGSPKLHWAAPEDSAKL